MTYNIPDSNGITFRTNINAALNSIANGSLAPNGNGSQLTNVNAAKVNGYGVWIGTQIQYGALGTYDSSTLYFISG